MGAEIWGLGSSEITIEGVEKLHGAAHRVMADRIEAGTYAIAAAIAGGEVELVGALPETIASLTALLTKSGAEVSATPRGMKVHMNGGAAACRRRHHRALSGLSHRPAGPDHGADDGGGRHLGDPGKDFREPLHACAGTGAHGRAGAHRRRHRHGARGGKAEGRAGDGDRSARLGVSWCWRAWRRKARPLVGRVYHLDRGFDRLEEKLSRVGADIARVSE